MNTATNNASSNVNPCAWDITVSYKEGGRVDTVSVRRLDGLAFEHSEHQIADHVRACLAADGIDARRETPVFARERTVLVVCD